MRPSRKSDQITFEISIEFLTKMKHSLNLDFASIVAPTVRTILGSEEQFRPIANQFHDELTRPIQSFEACG
jgi:hypothetical protein